MLSMKYRKRIYYTKADKALMWDRWQKGDTLHAIARLFDRHHSSVRGILERTGGIRPPVRRQSSRSLTLAEREEISRGIASGGSLRAIALRVGCSPSTLSRELARNGGSQGYRAHAADQAAWVTGRGRVIGDPMDWATRANLGIVAVVIGTVILALSVRVKGQYVDEPGRAVRRFKKVHPDMMEPTETTICRPLFWTGFFSLLLVQRFNCKSGGCRWN
jgi:hypothetical protein